VICRACGFGCNPYHRTRRQFPNPFHGGATAADTEEAFRELQEYEAMSRRAIKLLRSQRDDAHEVALAVLRGDLVGQ
jgi:hypothetical protein